MTHFRLQPLATAVALARRCTQYVVSTLLLLACERGVTGKRAGKRASMLDGERLSIMDNAKHANGLTT